MKFLIFGDIVGRPGREAIAKALPALREEYEPDSVIINAENIAHGQGMTEAAMKEAQAWRADVFTSGDHAWDNESGVELLSRKDSNIIRPANYPDGVPGRGYYIYTNGAWRIAVINLQGQVFFKNHPDNPFLCLDRLLAQEDIKQADVVLMDFHADATSEMRAMGWHANGRVAAVWGTHSHVPTADAQILPKGTGYITDVGMTGAYHSIIGMDPVGPMKTFLLQTKQKFEPPVDGPAEVNALYLEIDPQEGRTTRIANIRKILNDG
ncbi:MAG: TIGR00282 family metallophosphoesterase [bacterium]|nr:TIGR00282 family metallophosphoesterase [bacterium]MDZ4341861.1 TIGR00282 family metallophosphoesterase [Candidatus Binatia bacterium]